MRNSLAIESFLSFIRKNEARFSHVPVITGIGGRLLNFGLSGIIGEIRGSLTAHEIEIHAFYREDHWDIVDCFAMPLVRNRTGRYYCGECEESKARLYCSSRELFARHSFEPFLRWINATFDERTMLCFFETPGATWAKLLRKDLVAGDSDAECMIRSVAAVINT